MQQVKVPNPLTPKQPINISGLYPKPEGTGRVTGAGKRHAAAKRQRAANKAALQKFHQLIFECNMVVHLQYAREAIERLWAEIDALEIEAYEFDAARTKAANFDAAFKQWLRINKRRGGTPERLARLREQFTGEYESGN